MRCGAYAQRILGLAAISLTLGACAERVMAPAGRTEATAAMSVRADPLRDAVERVAPTLADAGRTTALTRALTALQTFLEAGQLPAAATQFERTRSLVRAARAGDDGSMAADLSAIDLALDVLDESLRAVRRSGGAHRQD